MLDRLFGTDPLTRRVAAVLVTAALVVVVVAIFAVQSFGSGGSSSYLLPSGPTQVPCASGAVLGHASPEDLVEHSELVFVGTVISESDPELIGDPVADPAGQGATVHKVRFAVERTLRGEHASKRDLLYPSFAGDTCDFFETGDRLLVFARPVIFGHNQIKGITPRGYYQGVFRMESEAVARNEFSGVRMSIAGLEDALR